MLTEETKEPKSPREPGKSSTIRKAARILLKIILFIFLFVVVVFLLVLTPPVQKFLTGRVENFLQNKLQTEVEIGGISFGLSGRIHLNNVYIEDRQKDTLVSGGTIKANLNLMKLFSNVVEVKDLHLQDITAKIKRQLPDTTFNFQFIVDAFTTPTTTPVDTAQTAPMELSLDKLTLDNVAVTYLDVVTGSDLFVRIGDMTTRFDSVNVNTSYYSLPAVRLHNTVARIRQTTPLATPEPVTEDVAEAAAPAALGLNIGTIDLQKVAVDYANDVSAFYTNLDIGKLLVDGRKLDLIKNLVYLDELTLNNTKAAIRMGNTAGAKTVEKEVKQEVQAQTTQPWDIRITRINLNGNTIRFDNETLPRQPYGMDYAHLFADSLTLQVKDLVMTPDSMGARVEKGYFKERNSGFHLQALEGDLLYANNQSYLKNLYVKTPGTELKRSLVLEYASFDALAKNFAHTVFDVELVDSRVLVKDILTFAPQLRSQPAFSNPNDVWHLNLIASGTLNRMYVETMQFRGLGNTVVNASGTLASLTDPNQAGGTFTIHRLHTTQNDIARLMGQQLPQGQLNLPQTIDVTGTLSGNAANLVTRLNISTSSGFAAVDGRFSNLTNPARAGYHARLRTSGLQLGKILMNDQIGTVTATVSVNGTGFTPDAMNTTFSGNIASAGFNNYQYRNVQLKGSLRRNHFTATVDSRDPNADLSLTARGNFAGTPSLTINGEVDSLKTLPLHFTTQPLIFRGKIDGSLPSLDPNALEANILLTDALFVSDTIRLQLDTLQLAAGRTDTGQFLRLNSDIMNAQLAGRYQLAELGAVLQNNINPYFSVSPGQKPVPVQPYDFSFTADVRYAPILTVFVPGLQAMEALRAEGSLATGRGLTASATTPYVVFNGNELHQVNARVATADSGMHITGTLSRLQSGAMDLYNVHLDAVALNNVINFNLGIDDKAGKDKYTLAGVVRQPAPGDLYISLAPSLLLNYEQWSLPPDNSISLINNQLYANKFILQQGGQQLSLQSEALTGNAPLNVHFQNFELGTITGFMKADTLLVGGNLNGSVILRNLMTQPVFTSDLTINNLSFKEDTVGNVALQVTSAGDRYNTNLTLTGKGNDMAVSGYFEQLANDIGLNLNLDINQLQLNTLKGAMAGFLTDASGRITGEVAITGTASDPRVLGDVNFDSARISTTLLGGPLTIHDESIKVTEQGFRFDQFTIRDSSGNSLSIDGAAATTNFINYNLDLDVTADNFKAVNSTKKAGSLFYGDLVLSTDMHIGGTEKAPVIDGGITIQDGTNFTVVAPQPEPGVVQREGIIKFANFDAPENDTLFRTAYDSLNVSGIQGFDIAVNIEIAKEAVFNMIIDEANGDFLNVQGTAQLSAGIDPSGKVTLVGSYELQQGAYQLSFNFLQRRFEIQKGSTITWLGEPTNAQLDVTAIYEANTASLDLVRDFISESNTVLRNRYLQKLPFEVHLRLEGELMKPQISFDILLPQDENYNVAQDVLDNVRTRLAQLRQEPSELNKQVFALLLLGRFVGPNPFESSGGGGGFSPESFARQSVSKLLTEQLNKLAGDLIAGVDLTFDVASTDDYTTGTRQNRTDLNVGLSKQLLNDRLTVTVGSNFMLEGPQQGPGGGSQRANNLAGDVSVQYQLSKDGRYLLRAYRKNQYQGVVDGYIIETGLSFIITLDYNHFRELFGNKKKEEASILPPQQPEEQKTNSTNGQ